MGHARLYTYAEAPVRTVRVPQDPFMAAGYVAGLPGVQAVVRSAAVTATSIARSVLAAHHDGDQERSSRPRIKMVRGDRTDYHVLLEVEAEGDPEAAAVAIEFGRGEYTDRLGRRQPAMQGVYALNAALDVMGL